ncbi:MULTISPECIES: hypothetical protein [unclassified Aeromicrobium]|uniref:hypothetical protein n=1 Tax=unclassified Aeromicrobium TaxID=2633570 RepID=UPI0007004746|nr:MULTISPECIES: hypothetical protein [unclassified Aeromicrobium]KQP27799.1 hypothetical protein ASF38_02910 [Aeromicrobium sp. Leaf272]KQP84163.1 hypothetical protein ASF35_04295 [Aeromicrobium sp. Leaf291]
MRIRTVSLTTAFAVMAMLTVGTVALVSATGGGDRSSASDAPAGIPTTSLTPPTTKPSPTPRPTKASDGTDEPADPKPSDRATAAPSKAPRTSAPRASSPRPAATTQRPAPAPSSAAPEPSATPGLLDGLLGPLLGD